MLLKINLTSHLGTSFVLESSSETNLELNGRFDLACIGLYDKTIEERFINTSLYGFDYNNVLVFKNCETNSKINQIIYSKEKGIEFIEFDDNSWIKLNE